ncbi:MAG: YIP1 family protein [Planctomycetes bacterium]|nr:YIP1 family protein [Planctomycetota bacterium]
MLTPTRSTVGILDVPLALLAPRRVFQRIEDVAAYGWPLVVLLTAVTLAGWATVETGLVDRQVNQQVEAGIAKLEREQADVVERAALSQMIQDQRKAGEFTRMITRVQMIGAEPVRILACVLLLAALFYGLVALTGKKPEWHTLMTIMVFAGFADLLGSVVRLGMMLHFRRLEVETSLAAALPLLGASGVEPRHLAPLAGMLTAVDPFRLWFWGLVIIGLATTAQLRGWRAWVPCLLLWLSGGGLRAALAAGGGV